MRHALGYATTVVAALCWGASGVSADYLMERHGIELSLVSFFRMFTAGILTLGFALARARRVTPQHRALVSSARNWRTLVVYALFGLAACQISYMGSSAPPTPGRARSWSTWVSSSSSCGYA